MSLKRISMLLLSMLFLPVALVLGAGAAFALDAPAWPTEIYQVDARASLELDRLGHQVLLERVSPGERQAGAFVERALTHDRYSNGGFGLDSMPLLT